MVRDLVEDKPSSLFSNQWLFSLEIYFGFEFWVFQCLLSMGAERERERERRNWVCVAERNVGFVVWSMAMSP